MVIVVSRERWMASGSVLLGGGLEGGSWQGVSCHAPSGDTHLGVASSWSGDRPGDSDVSEQESVREDGAGGGELCKGASRWREAQRRPKEVRRLEISGKTKGKLAWAGRPKRAVRPAAFTHRWTAATLRAGGGQAASVGVARPASCSIEHL